LRLRIFAGPNGSGKSTIIQSVRETIVNGRKIDMGFYINADDIVLQIRERRFSFDEFAIKVTQKRLQAFAVGSGLLSANFTEQQLNKSYHIRLNQLYLKDLSRLDELGQIVARFLREAMLEQRRRFSFETVFSHPSNIATIQLAVKNGYKVYLYFVSTESPEINKFRVAYRVSQHGHDVPARKIVDRYARSLDLLYDAAQYCYQVYFFDNSRDGTPFALTAHFKKVGDRKVWDKIPRKNIAGWFKKYYLEKEKANSPE
jgi:predicted ABC-type ATPase